MRIDKFLTMKFWYDKEDFDITWEKILIMVKIIPFMQVQKEQ